MNKNVLFILISSIGVYMPGRAQDWHKTQIADSVTLDFPIEPTKRNVSNAIAYGTYDEGVLYSVAIQKGAFGAEATLPEKQEFYDNALQGAADKVKAPSLLDKKYFAINGFAGVEAKFLPTISRLTTPVYMRLVLVNGTCYGLMFSATPNVMHSAARQRFFTSFTPRVHPVASTPALNRTAAYKIGHLLGTLFFYGMLVVGAILLLKRLNASKEKEA